ncbi:MAG TPA: ion channel [Polyangiaceae bacterium]|jgi:inward rectifier potassium channel|nr:ion channel [Polyangiaceae bacterium]
MVKTTSISPDGADYEIRVVGEHRAPLRDFYHAMMRLSWTATLLVIAASFLLVNCVFAVGYLLIDGVKGAHPGSLSDAFFFSVETMGTIGYGAMYPESIGANVLMVGESIVSLILTALATGLVFAKFSRPTARVVFTREAVVSSLNGVPTLMLRLGNERGNQIVDVRIRAVMIRAEHLDDGSTFYRMLDLKLSRAHALSLSRSWSVQHPIDAHSPLHGATAQSLIDEEAELQILIVGLDDTSMQTIHASHRYYAKQVIFDAKHADILTEADDGALILDLRKFHDVVPNSKAGA